jgi:hypothetical protein
VANSGALDFQRHAAQLDGAGGEPERVGAMDLPRDAGADAADEESGRSASRGTGHIAFRFMLKWRDSSMFMQLKIFTYTFDPVRSSVNNVASVEY